MRGVCAYLHGEWQGEGLAGEDEVLAGRGGDRAGGGHPSAGTDAAVAIEVEWIYAVPSTA